MVPADLDLLTRRAACDQLVFLLALVVVHNKSIYACSLLFLPKGLWDIHERLASGLLWTTRLYLEQAAATDITSQSRDMSLTLL